METSFMVNIDQFNYFDVEFKTLIFKDWKILHTLPNDKSADSRAIL